MCDPVTLTVAATAVAAAGTIYKGVQANQQAHYEAKVADNNAQQQIEAAKDAQSRGETTLRDTYRRAAALKGEQVASMSANGLDTSFGSALDVQRDTAMLGQDDALNVASNTANEMRGYEVNAADYTAQGQADRAKGKGALIGSFFDAGGTILSGATQFSKLKAGMGAPKLGYDMGGF